MECDTLLPQTVPNGHLPVCHYPTRCVELSSETDGGFQNKTQNFNRISTAEKRVCVFSVLLLWTPQKMRSGSLLIVVVSSSVVQIIVNGPAAILMIPLVGSLTDSG